MADVSQLGQQRNRVLVAVYELTDGHPIKSVTATEVAAAAGLTEETVESAVRWLADRGLLEFSSLAGDFSLTPRGSDEAERLLTDDANFATAVLTVEELRVLEAFTREVRVALDNATLDPDTRADADAQLATIEAQQRSPKPRRAVIGFAIRALQATAGPVVGGILGNAAYAALRTLIT